MKKCVFTTISLAFIFIFSLSLSIEQSVAQENNGSSQTTEQTDECYSGLRYKCEGSGTLCETTGWICSSKKNKEISLF